MKLVQGKYAEALVLTNDVDDNALQQAQTITDQPFAKNAHVRFMPDIHAGNGCPIGLTMNFNWEKFCPSVIGTDTGCGVLAERLYEKEGEVDFQKLDNVIRNEIPSGNEIRKILPRDNTYVYGIAHRLADMHCSSVIDLQYAFLSMGTLGGGNHFIEVDVDEEGRYWLVIHSGSRNLGARVNKYYQNLAVRNCAKVDRSEFIQQMKAEGREKEIQTELKKLPKRITPKEMSYLEDRQLTEYLDDAKACETYADINRTFIADIIIEAMGLHPSGCHRIDTKHNYIDAHNVIRKGAVAAYKDEELIIPMNMRDGALICVGKGNPEWNYSAPHGAGRAMSRTEAKKELSLNDFKATMTGIYSTSVVKETLDEAPAAYKPVESIIENISDTVTIKSRLRPVYNFKGY